MKKRLIITSIFVACLSTSVFFAANAGPTIVDCGSFGGNPNEQCTEINVLSFNDYHGIVEEGSSDPGLAKFSTYINTVTAENPNSIVVSAGDNFNGSVTSNTLMGRPVAEAFNFFGEYQTPILLEDNLGQTKQTSNGVAFSSIGNHEFDWGADKFTANVPDLNGDLTNGWDRYMGNSSFLAANIIDKQTGQIPNFLKPYSYAYFDTDNNGVYTDQTDIKVGFIGLATPETAFKGSPDIVKNYDFLDPSDTVNQYIKQLEADNADLIIVQAHMSSFQNDGVVSGELNAEGTDELAQIAAIDGIDGIISGHSHQPVVGYLNSVPLVQANKQGRNLGQLSYVYNLTTKTIVEATPKLTDVRAIKDTITPNQTVIDQIVNPAIAQVGPLKDEVLGNSDYELIHDRYSGATATQLGMLTSDIALKEISPNGQKAKIFIQNGGGLRTSINAGPITYGEVYELLPFDNVLSYWELTGAQIWEAMQWGLNPANAIGFAEYAGFKVYGNENGSQIYRIVLNDGTIVTNDDKQKILVATNDFMASGGDNYTMFQKGTFIGEGRIIRDSIVDYMRSIPNYQVPSLYSKPDNRYTKYTSSDQTANYDLTFNQKTNELLINWDKLDNFALKDAKVQIQITDTKTQKSGVQTVVANLELSSKGSAVIPLTINAPSTIEVELSTTDILDVVQTTRKSFKKNIDSVNPSTPPDISPDGSTKPNVDTTLTNTGASPLPFLIIPIVGLMIYFLKRISSTKSILK
ncbi:MAG: bifunctional metallophosphatase/5'-nucleotidase [Mycoplasmatales bacterium]